MKVLITGGSGFLGSHTVEALIDAGHQVKALVRPSSDTRVLTRLGAELALASLETGDGLDRAVEDVDAVIHGAGIVKARSPEEFQRVNVGGTEKLLEAAKTRGGMKRFVLVSSLTAHGFGDRAPRPVDHEPAPVTNYGKSKLAAEKVVLAAKDDLPVTVLRPPAIYGPRDVEMFQFFQLVNRRFIPFLGNPDNTLSLIYAPDCAKALVQTVTRDHPSGRTYFIDDGRVYTQRQFAAILEGALGVRALRLSVPMPVVNAAALGSELFGRVTNKAVMLTRDKVNELRQTCLACPVDKAREELAWEPQTELEEGARITARWYREEGWL